MTPVSFSRLYGGTPYGYINNVPNINTPFLKSIRESHGGYVYYSKQLSVLCPVTERRKNFHFVVEDRGRNYLVCREYSKTKQSWFACAHAGPRRHISSLDPVRAPAMGGNLHPPALIVSTPPP